MGGAGSLRGYKEIDHPFIGNKQVLFNTELRFNFNQTVQTVLFYDFGKTFQDKINFDLETYETGFGAGLRFFTPVGPLRIDVARSNHTIIHFGLGQLF